MRSALTEEGLSRKEHLTIAFWGPCVSSDNTVDVPELADRYQKSPFICHHNSSTCCQSLVLKAIAASYGTELQLKRNVCEGFSGYEPRRDTSLTFETEKFVVNVNKMHSSLASEEARFGGSKFRAAVADLAHANMLVITMPIDVPAVLAKKMLIQLGSISAASPDVRLNVVLITQSDWSKSGARQGEAEVAPLRPEDAFKQQREEMVKIVQRLGVEKKWCFLPAQPPDLTSETQVGDNVTQLCSHTPWWTGVSLPKSAAASFPLMVNQTCEGSNQVPTMLLVWHEYILIEFSLLLLRCKP